MVDLISNLFDSDFVNILAIIIGVIGAGIVYRLYPNEFEN